MLLHGFGASAGEMAAWSEGIIAGMSKQKMQKPWRVVAVCPQAPIPPGFQVPAWWPLDELKFRNAFLAGESQMASAIRENSCDESSEEFVWVMASEVSDSKMGGGEGGQHANE